ncbi:MAG: DUF1015 domain-containing protein [Candidatus Omnitrophica bacterium]|nr:DUF1015 domain-containing protein [Candidatus Omnitrophota bacterium]
MTIIKPFNGYRYDTRVTGKLSKVITPPYDVINPKQQEEYYRAHPENFIRLDLGKKYADDGRDDNRYTRAARALEEWISRGVLVRDREPSIYVYSQEYTIGGKKKARLGFISLAKLEEDRTKGFLPHERTFKGPKLDRLNLMKETGANLSPVFSIVFDDNNRIMDMLKRASKGRRPAIDVAFEGTRNRIWRMTDPALIKKLEGLMAGKKALIADGHHRYEVALEFRALSKEKPGSAGGLLPRDYVMMYFATSDPKGLAILPTHRMLEGVSAKEFLKNSARLKEYFDIIRTEGRKGMLACMKRCGGHVIGVYLGGKDYLCLKLKKTDASSLIKSENSSYWRNLDVVILHNLVFDKALGLKGEDAEKAITFTRDPEVAFKWASGRGKRISFFLNPPSLKDIYNIVRCRERMPHKTTYFFPKPPSGLVINKLE